jgi:uncharacterized membrane protein YesL
MNQILFLIFGIIAGILYYNMMKISIEESHKNCSFVANKMSDILAFLVGGILLYYGLRIYNDYVLATIGIAIITEHILQITYKF